MQTHGRARVDTRSWDSEKGKNLLFTVLLPQDKDVISCLRETFVDTFIVYSFSSLPPEYAARHPRRIHRGRPRSTGTQPRCLDQVSE